MPEQFDAHSAMAAFSETDLGGRDAVADYGCKTPPSRMVPPSRAPKRPRGWASWYGADRFRRIRVCRPSGLSIGEPPRMGTEMTAPLHHCPRRHPANLETLP
jgi:hypothetical protein